MSDRELDAKMAELMGWVRGDSIFRSYWAIDLPDGSQELVDERIDEWQPSRDIAAAMLVADKMHRDDFWWSASYKETYVDEIFQAGYSVTFRCVRAGTRGDHTATALTLSEAICRAALLAAEAE